MRRTLVKFNVWTVFLAAALLVGGCAKKQVVSVGEVPPPTPVAQPEEPPPAKVTARPVQETVEAPPQASGAETRVEAERTGTMESTQTAALPAPTSKGLQRIHFAFDEHLLRPDARSLLQENARYLKTNAGTRIQIQGHCDERGTVEYNLALGERRARSAFRFLGDLGVDLTRMSVISYGEESPLVTGHNEEAWAKNRRAEFVEVN